MQRDCKLKGCLLVRQDSKNFRFWTGNVFNLELEDFINFDMYLCLNHACFQPGHGSAKTAEIELMTHLTTEFGVMYSFELNLPKSYQNRSVRPTSFSAALQATMENRPFVKATERVVDKLVSDVILPAVEVLSKKIDGLPNMVHSNIAELVPTISNLNQKIEKK